MKKLLAIVLSLVMVLSFVACGTTENTESEGTQASGESQESQEVPAVTTAQEGKLIIATNAAFPPYEFVNDNDEFDGIDVALAKAIGEKLGLEVEINDMEFASILTAVQGGKADLAMAGLTVTEDRKKNVNFTTSYAKGVQSIIVKEGSDIKTADDLAGKKIGVQESTTGHIYCEDDFGTENVTAYPVGASAVEALLADKVDCVVIDNNPAKEFVKANEGLVILDTAYTEEDYAIAVSKDNEALLKAVDDILQELISSGKVQEILDTYIKAE